MASARFISRTNRSEAGEKRKTDFDESFGRTDVSKITDEWTDDEAICYSGRFAPGKKIIFSVMKKHLKSLNLEFRRIFEKLA